MRVTYEGIEGVKSKLKKELAASLYTICARKNPGDSPIWIHIAGAKEEVGDKVEAMEKTPMSNELWVSMLILAGYSGECPAIRLKLL